MNARRFALPVWIGSRVVAPFLSWVALLLGVAVATTPASALLTSPFDTSAQGWLLTGDNGSLWRAMTNADSRSARRGELATHVDHAILERDGVDLGTRAGIPCRE